MKSLVREEIDALPLVVESAINLEAIWLRLRRRSGRGCCIIGSVYRSPSSCPSAFFESLEEAIAFIRSAHPNSEIIICGDTNSHLQEWGDSRTESAGRSALSFCISTGMAQTVRVPTLILGSGSRSVIDQCYTDLPDHAIHTNIVPGIESSWGVHHPCLHPQT